MYFAGRLRKWQATFQLSPLNPGSDVSSWPIAAVRLPGPEGRLTWHSSRSTTWARPAGVDRGGLHGAHVRILDAGLSRTFAELFDGPRLTS